MDAIEVSGAAGVGAGSDGIADGPDGRTSRGRHVDVPLLLAPVLALLSLLVLSVPGRTPARLACLGGWVVVVGWAVAELVARLRRPGGDRGVNVSAGDSLLRFLAVGAAAAIVAAAAVLHAPLRFRFALSEDDLTTAALAVLDGGAPTGERVGSYRVESAQTDGTNVWLVTSGLGTREKWGFAYLPAGTAPPASGSYPLDLGDGWWLWAPAGASVTV